jgi:hypothetical protein
VEKFLEVLRSAKFCFHVLWFASLKSSGNTILRTAIIIKLISGFFKSREFKRDIFGKSTKYELTDFSIVNVRQVQFPGIVIIQTGVFSSEFKITVSMTACAWTRNQILLFKTRELRDKLFSQNDQKIDFSSFSLGQNYWFCFYTSFKFDWLKSTALKNNIISGSPKWGYLTF